MERYLDVCGNSAAGVFDVCIIGGGISGSAIAYTLSLLGYKVALFEKGDFGGGTTAATTKMIHGGARYLKTLEFRLVRESLRERRILCDIAPNFVYPKPVFLTTSDYPKSNKGLIRAGMICYDLLSYDKGWTRDKSKKIPWHNFLPAEAVLAAEPAIRDENLTGAFVYEDCFNIFPERLNLAFLKSALKNGARIANYAEVFDFLYSSGRRAVSGVKVFDRISRQSFLIRSRLTINCAGPWADAVLGLISGQEEKPALTRSEGVHIITRPICRKNMIGFFPRGGRHFFIIPFRGHSLIGTTDRPYSGHPDNYRVSAEGIDELLSLVNRHVKEPIGWPDIKYAYGGLRPLAGENGADTYNASRSHEICDAARDGLDGLITVLGGKYTTSRNLAERVAGVVAKKLGVYPWRSASDKLYLSGCEITDMELFMSKLHALYDGDFSRETVEYLGRNYGTEAKEVFRLTEDDPSLREVLNVDGEIMAEVVYAVKFEMARTLSDIILRRTGIGALGKPDRRTLVKVASTAAIELDWKADNIIDELDRASRIYELPAIIKKE
ncbi:hypothetical protein A2303_03825 [Candidatus Falkowbacteria bacterium RIFOXYB2_FULL_47_14]|uniref:FAD dependent oxidoreductase domain-containing protein n=1 Tax=Candidatus Falkowbacteria bacterium RIFOXYA2_FULL_47_19 TaxID=1797994 RepID=A0A1F5SHZ6_9BACT|nr:MAG: hypothetical protein A2227_03370 [Candidatus Falkowbacteria bacterium RIFOXYA2_FULL_47_19]OGF42525.1 MAG: hypothetical protein A2303_03825 [Candidatus Falkowbacteria bacterium RIFOXYB2_FULL_47_14]